LKWLRLSGLVMLLPHGFEGQGPEHSSARLERYLQLCAQSNMRVVNCSTPANFFHVLRRQLKSDTRKPLIVMTPKSVLRHPRAVSTFSDMGPATTFTPLFDDTTADPAQIKRVVLCSGKVYYDLLEGREKLGRNDVALIRLEQYYPFPLTQLKRVLSKYASAEFVWCQEEPKNMGAWMFLDRRIEAVIREIGSQEPLYYAGRAAAASPATGVMSRHLEEQRQLVQEALTLSGSGSKKGLFAV
jgi:2-oxoglutarate dehydrogenase E1 component